MCLQAVVLVTLAFIGTSSLNVWSATAHPLIYGSTSSIVPRTGGQDIPIEQITQECISARQFKYSKDPKKVVQLAFYTADGREKQVRVQCWSQISGLLAKGISDLSMDHTRVQDLKLPKIVVTGYFHGDIPLLDHEQWQQSHGAQLRVAALQPPGWDLGTAVWQYIFALRPGFDEIPKIALANPGWSTMLHEVRNQEQHLVGYRLLSKSEKAKVLAGQPSHDYEQVIWFNHPS